MAMPRWWRPLAVLPRRPESPSRYSSERSGTFLSRHFHKGRGGSGLRNRVAILAHAAEVYFHCRSDAFPDFSFGLPGRAASGEVGNVSPVPCFGMLNYDGVFERFSHACNSFRVKPACRNIEFSSPAGTSSLRSPTSVTLPGLTEGGWKSVGE